MSLTPRLKTRIDDSFKLSKVIESDSSGKKKLRWGLFIAFLVGLVPKKANVHKGKNEYIQGVRAKRVRKRIFYFLVPEQKGFVL